jgi:hypothetical protein
MFAVVGIGMLFVALMIMMLIFLCAIIIGNSLYGLEQEKLPKKNAASAAILMGLSVAALHYVLPNWHLLLVVMGEFLVITAFIWIYFEILGFKNPNK